jgi:hypothetical protein
VAIQPFASSSFFIERWLSARGCGLISPSHPR